MIQKSEVFCRHLWRGIGGGAAISLSLNTPCGRRGYFAIAQYALQAARLFRYRSIRLRGAPISAKYGALGVLLPGGNTPAF